MKILHVLLVRFFAAAMLLGASGALAQPTNEGRCASDQLTPAQANERIEWALRCGYISAQKAFDYRYFYNFSTGKVEPKASYTYPVFGWPASATSNAVVWVAPLDRNTSCPVAYSATLGGSARVVSDCVAGCYTPEQKLLFSKGEVTVRDAQETRRTDVVTLRTIATMERLAFQVGKVAAYTVDIFDTDQAVLNIRTKSGGLLRVTPNHPIVDGSGVVRQASEFSVGDDLIRENGSFDPIVSIDKEMFYGKTYNLKPDTFDPMTNIVVAQGFLSGSGRYQDKTVIEGNRTLLRRNIPESALAP